MTGLLDLLTTEQREAIEAVAWVEMNTDNQDRGRLGLKIQTMAGQMKLETPTITEYLERLELVFRPQKLATLYYNQGDFVARRRCFNLTNGLTALPPNCVPCAMFVGGQGAIYYPITLHNSIQRTDLSEKVIWAMLKVGEMNAEEKAKVLIATGRVDIEIYKPNLTPKPPKVTD